MTNGKIRITMCIIFIVITAFLAISFFSNGDTLYAVLSAAVCSVLLFFFIRNLINNGACLFSRKKDCNKGSDSLNYK